ncbi:MAG: alpha/beta hydrolase [Candidatus Azambacteria bacterium]|nr:alpha/beta hydrolase [Candidatus Azambacteria bacterium]
MMNEFFFKPRGIYYRINKFQTSRQTLVFIHGLSGSSSAWLEYEKKFEKKYNLLSLDIRGHGKSAKLKNYEDYEIEKFSQDIYDLITYLNIEKPILISHSFGTLIALEFLVKYQNLLASSVFLSPIFSLKKQKSAQFVHSIIGLLSGFLKIFPVSTKIGNHIDYSKYKNTGDWNIRRTFADVRNTGLRVFLYCLKQSYKFDRKGFLGSINIPVLIVHGKKDTIFSVKNSVIMAERINNSKLILLDNADHIIVLNNFTEVSEAIENFI